MIEKINNFTENDITVYINNNWYCFPFVILEDEPLFMKQVWAQFGYDPSGLTVDEKEPDDPSHFYRLLDQGKINLIRTYFRQNQRPYLKMQEFITNNPGRFESLLITCKLP